MKKTFWVTVLVVVFAILCGICTYATSMEFVEVEGANEILGEDEMQTPFVSSNNASLYALLNGKGTKEEPYEIHNANDLVTFADSINSGINTVGKGEIDNAIFTAEGHSGLRDSLGQQMQAASLTASQEHCDCFFFSDHAISP